MLRPDSSGSEDGFVLIEILCALVIVGISAIAFLRLASQSADRTFQAKTEAATQTMAQTLLDRECQKHFADIREQSAITSDGTYEWFIAVTRPEGYAEPNNEQPVLASIYIRVRVAKSKTAPIERRHIHAYGHSS